ncbi:FAD binding domain-containing protein [Streptomyces sp. NPDC003016]
MPSTPNRLRSVGCVLLTQGATKQGMSAVDLLRPATWAEALDAKVQHPGATPIGGGTDVMAEIGTVDRQPATLPGLTGVGELAEGPGADGRSRTGAGLPRPRTIDELGARLPGPAVASRTVGSPQISGRGTLGGHLAAAPPRARGAHRWSPPTRRSRVPPFAAVA